MNRFWDLLAQSVIVQGLITVAFVGIVIYLVIVDRVIPPLIETTFGLVLGFWFGTKSQAAISARSR